MNECVGFVVESGWVDRVVVMMLVVVVEM